MVDPRRDIDEYLQIARSNNLTITHVLETHRQEDFEFGSRNLQQATGAKIVTGKHELFGKSDIKLADGEELKIGATRFVALATPGHTPESMSYAVYAKDSGDKCWAVLTGDSLFVGETGRTDLTDPDKAVEHAAQLLRLGAREDQAARRPDAGAAGARRRLGVRRQCLGSRRHHARHRVRDQPGVHDEPRRVRAATRAPRSCRARRTSATWRRSTSRAAARCRRRRASTCCSRRCSASSSTAAC